MLERRAEHETHSKRVFSSRRRASFTTPNSHIPHMHQLVCLGDSVLRAVCWGTFSFIKNQSCPNPHFLWDLQAGFPEWLFPSGRKLTMSTLVWSLARYISCLKIKRHIHAHPYFILFHFFYCSGFVGWISLNLSLSLQSIGYPFLYCGLLWIQLTVT